MDNFIVETVKDLNEDLLKAINSLLVHLNLSSEELSREDLESMINASSNRLIIAKEKDSGKIIGMITLIVYRIPFIKKGVLEDFVVDPQYRGKGIGKNLIDSALNIARSENLKYVDLTSKPEKEAANNLYHRMGFDKRGTNVYRVNL